MQRHEQEPGKPKSVLTDKKNIAGLRSNKKSPVEKAQADKDATAACESALDGPACIEGVPVQAGRRK